MSVYRVTFWESASSIPFCFCADNLRICRRELRKMVEESFINSAKGHIERRGLEHIGPIYACRNVKGRAVRVN
jgi:hypothetical protein